MFRRGYRYMLYTTFIVYTSVSAQVFAAFPVGGASRGVAVCAAVCVFRQYAHCGSALQCTTFEDGSSWLTVDMSISCLDKDRWAWVMYAIVCMIVYPIGVLVWYTAVLLTHRKSLNPPCPKGLPKSVWRSRVIHAIRPKDRSIRHINFLFGNCACGV